MRCGCVAPSELRWGTIYSLGMKDMSTWCGVVCWPLNGVEGGERKNSNLLISAFGMQAGC